MKRIGEGIRECLDAVNASDEASRKARRAAEVQQAWRAAVERVYKDAAAFVLGHINAVYFLREEDRVCATVYADDSLVRSDIDARQEFIKMALADTGERVDTFRILASRFSMKDRHPFESPSGSVPEGDPSRAFEKAVRAPLSADRLRDVDACVSVVDDPRVRESLRKAMIAEFEYHGSN